MKLDILQTVLSFFLTLKHNFVVRFSKFNSESNITSNYLLLKIAARGILSIETVSSFLVLTKIWDFPRLAFHWVFLNQWKSLDAEVL